MAKSTAEADRAEASKLRDDLRRSSETERSLHEDLRREREDLRKLNAEAARAREELQCRQLSDESNKAEIETLKKELEFEKKRSSDHQENCDKAKRERKE